MIKARNKKVSLLLVLAMMMTMFAGLGVANATTGYSSSHQPLVATNATGQNLGAVIVTFDNLPVGADPGFILKLPADFDLTNSYATGVTTDITSSIIKPEAPVPAGLRVYATGSAANKVVISVVNTGAIIPELKFGVNLNNVFVPDTAEDTINAAILARPGSVFGDAAAIPVGKTSGKSVIAIAGDQVTISAGGIVNTANAIIYLRENKASALQKSSRSFTLKLPAGFSWVDTQYGISASGVTNPFTITKTDSRTLEFSRGTDTVPAQIWTFSAGQIDVDESVAKFGDVAVTIGGASSIAPSSVVIGTYADYGVKVNIDKPETQVIAGRDDQYVSDIEIAELLGDSLLPNRTIYIELPDGLRWEDPTQFSKDEVGGVSCTMTRVENKPEILKLVMASTDPGSAKGKIQINRAMIEVAGNFTGDIKAKFWGNAGVNEELIIGKVIAPISVTADVKDVKIGLQKQVAGSITITETEAEAILSSRYTAGTNATRVYSDVLGWITYDDAVAGSSDSTALAVTLPFNVTWSNVPTVKVLEGDIQLGTVTTNANGLLIPILNASSVASKIEITDVNYTLDRTVPEGEMKATFGGSAVVQTVFANRNYVVKEVVANCVTPAPDETIGTGEFRIGSNIYYVAGVAKVMDVAPYIKGARTYVPMRYLGEILGAEVVWDADAKTVTLTKGDTTVVFTIGSTTYTVNGEAKTADVAPEIVSDRTMLPARFVAEAFGAVVGWDASTQTVVISK